MVDVKNKGDGFTLRWRDIYFNVEGREVVKRAFFSDFPVFGFEANELSEKLGKYFEGEKVSFECKFQLNLPLFTKKVLEKVLEIPYGKITTYGEIAEKLESHPRAVGQALKRNPIAVLIPCHRVVAKNGMGGYSWGVEIKKALLRLERIDLF